MISLEKSKLDEVVIIKPNVFEDHRGEYVETYNEKIFKEHGINIKFVQDDFSISTKNVLRGIHGDLKTWKLVSCPYGKFYLIVVNHDEKTEQYKKWTSFVLSDKNRWMVLIPPKFGNGHLVLSNTALFHYKQSTYYNPKNQFTIKWNDSDMKFWWPIKKPILSKRDEVGHYV